jgi:hypothetical protein
MKKLLVILTLLTAVVLSYALVLNPLADALTNTERSLKQHVEPKAPSPLTYRMISRDTAVVSVAPNRTGKYRVVGELELCGNKIKILPGGEPRRSPVAEPIPVDPMIFIVMLAGIAGLIAMDWFAGWVRRTFGVTL